MVQQTIMIPTDFTIASLSLLKVALQHFRNEPLRILFVNGYDPGDSITDLLFYSEQRIIDEHESSDFREACAVLRNKFGHEMLNIQTVLFNGKTQQSFNHFLSSFQVEKVVVPVNGLPKGNDSCGVHLYRFLKNCKAEKLLVEWEAKPLLPEQDRLAELFAL